MRNFIISTYEKLLYLAVVIAVLSGFFTGYNINPYNTSILAGLIGACIGFIGSVIIVGLLLTIISIKETVDAQHQELGRIKSILEDMGYQYRQSLKK